MKKLENMTEQEFKDNLRKCSDRAILEMLAMFIWGIHLTQEENK